MDFSYDDAVSSHDLEPHVCRAECVPNDHDQVIGKNGYVVGNVSEPFDVPGPIIRVEILNCTRAFEPTGLVEEKQFVGMWCVVHHEEAFGRNKCEPIYKLIKLGVFELADSVERAFFCELNGEEFVTVHHHQLALQCA